MGVFLEIMQNDTGTLQVCVFNISVAVPVQNATVIITDPEDENNNFRIELTTDNSGRTETISLPAPPVANSLTPEGNQPFKEYNITVTSEGFETINIYGVQVFPDMLAIQNVYLNPREQKETIEIDYPTLWGDFPEKIPEDEEKDIKEETGFVVLDYPVIPEFVVVHDGDPNDSSAPNYYVRFTDYIKNVACCEIYSTWPDAAIRANVLCIISFTLNRVFTEWYRSRGKNFTITSSTRYDQAFSYGRTIYEEISIIVDEMFNTYITRPGIRQPLFTQYCDGSRVYCPEWLSQWGSKELADQGYTTIQILRNYYGNNIYLEQAENVVGVPSSFPGENLTIGSQGNAVRTIQEQLNSISNRYTAINKLAVDGVYGENTAEAVREFQNIFNMPQSGIVDFPTWYEISRVYVSIERLAELV